jgi:threonine dehydratase
MVEPPSLAAIEATHARLDGLVATTPVHEWRLGQIALRLPPGTRAVLKLELFQVTGSFKPRGALAVMQALSPAELARGVVAVSAGNHTIATAYAARVLGTSAKVVMMQAANPVRIARCRAYGAEIVLVPDVHTAFALAEEIREDEGRALVHPFEGPHTALGTASLGLEFARQAGPLDALVLPIGGGGLAAGMATAFRHLQPDCRIFGVEPQGADSMRRSFVAGRPEGVERVRTIADSLGAPFALPYSFGLCRRAIEEIVLVSDEEMRGAMALLLDDLKLMVEPAGAASTAALLGPLRERLAGLRVGLICCGSTIDLAGFSAHIESSGAAL